MNSYPQKLSIGTSNLWTTRISRLNYPQPVSNLTKVVASQLAGEPPRRIARGRCLVLVAVLCVIGITPAKAVTQTDLLRLYAHSRIINYEQFKCFDALITRESHWNVKAVSPSGNHYGLGQMRNAKYGRLDGFTQVDWTLRYIKKRYGSMCNAWSFFKANGYH